MSGIYSGSLDSKEHHLVVKTFVGPVFESGGTIVYVREGVVVAQAFDERKLVVSGEPVTLPDHVGFNSVNSSAFFSISPAGEMVYYPASPNGPIALSWYDRDGKRGDTLDASGYLSGVTLSPNGTRAVASIYSADGLSVDLWNYDLSRGTKTRLTSGPKSKQNPVWQPDGKFVLFSSAFTGGAVQNIDRVRSDGSGGVEPVLSSDAHMGPRSVCSDGHYLAYWQIPGIRRLNRSGFFLLRETESPSL